MQPAEGPGARRAAAFDAGGLLLLLLALCDYLRPSLLLLGTVTAGGDTASHYPTAVFLYEQLLPQLRVHGWYPGAYLGHPLLLYYFPLPFLAMAALAPAAGMPVAFKLGSVLGVFLLPVCAYACLRCLGFRFPGPLLGAAAAFAFLLVEENPIWGGTLASTLAGEFSYTYGAAFALLFLGAAYRDYARGEPPWRCALLLGLTGLAHGYAVLWAGLASTFFLYGARRPGRALGWLLAVALLAFGLIAFWLLPLLADWRWTTPFNDAWISVGWRQLLPEAVLPLLVLGLLGPLTSLLLSRRGGGADRRLLYLGNAALAGLALAAAAPPLGVIDVRLLPFAQLALTLAGAATLALLLSRARHPALAAAGVVLLLVAWADSRSRVLRYWSEYDYSGLEAKPLWPEWRALNEQLRGGVGSPRVAVEYSSEHERAGSIRMYETLPFFSGRSTLEGVYNQASLNTHAVYYLASELGERSPNPFKNVEFGSFDTDAALRHLQLFAADTVVALSPKLKQSLEARSDVRRLDAPRPYAVYALAEAARYVEPLECAPVRSPESGWRARALRWFARNPLPCAPLVFADDASAFVAEPDEWLAPPERRLPGGVRVSERVLPEAIHIRTDRIGHPLLVKVSWHPRWRAEGASGPYRVAPALMLVVPERTDVTLRYQPNWADTVGRVVSLAAWPIVLGGLAGIWRRATPVPRSAALPLPIRLLLAGGTLPGRRWGGLVPGALLLLLFGARLLPDARAATRAREADALQALAGRALAEGRSLDAAEYARHGLTRLPASPARDALACLRGDALLAAGRPHEARREFSAVLAVPGSPSAARARRGLEAAAAAGRREP
jgi:hypothetical protein